MRDSKVIISLEPESVPCPRFPRTNGPKTSVFSPNLNTAERRQNMKFIVKACSGRARAGILHLASCPNPIETPALLLATRKGLPSFMTRDLLASLASSDSLLLQASPLHFLECASPETISKIGGLHRMVGLDEHGFVAVPRDSIVCLPESESTNKHGASLETPSSRVLIKPVLYMEMISSLKPNLWASVADEVPAWVSEKRNKTSVDRTVRWLDECLALDQTGGETMLGAIVGGTSLTERARCADEVAKRNVSGYWIGGFGLGENMDERAALLNAVMDNIPDGKLRQICGTGLPEEILQGVAAGIDLFDSTYIYHLTLGGFALTFPLYKNERSLYDPLLSEVGSDKAKINLRATVYRKDTTPIVDGCKCYTCQNHTRAYINHLLNVHEMLAQILLEIHNTHHYLGFFHLIRDAIMCGEFDLIHQNFIRGRRIIMQVLHYVRKLLVISTILLCRLLTTFMSYYGGKFLHIFSHM